ncbi:MAG: hypothetical protein Kow0069_13170 [Promethearchaeota archaeon]
MEKKVKIAALVGSWAFSAASVAFLLVVRWEQVEGALRPHAAYLSGIAGVVALFCSMAEFAAVMDAAMRLFFSPTNFSYRFEVIQNETPLGGSVLGIRRVGAVGAYECGCFAMRSGWYEAMGLDARETCTKCLLEGDEVCEIRVDVTWEPGGGDHEGQ